METARFKIVDADPLHMREVCDIYNQAVRETVAIWTDVETTTELRRDWLMARRAASFPVLVAIDTIGAVLGYGSFGVFRDSPGYSQTVEHSVYVAPSAQRQGVGRALLSALIDKARVRNLETMVGGIDSSNAASIALHESFGFERQGELKRVGRKFGQRLDLVFMVKSL